MDIENPFKAFYRLLRSWKMRAAYARVVDQCIETAELLRDRTEGGAHLCFLRYIAADICMPLAQFPGPLRCTIGIDVE
jgi:hypothetical protein